MILEKTWRWFGENDPISLAEIRQTGATGIVTALHHIPNGEVWSVEEIQKKKAEIEHHGLTWSVVESLPVSEEIKYAGPDRDRLIDNYKQSIRNLGACGIDIVCYNFMPVLDWARTDLHYRLPDGHQTLYFDRTKFVAFEIFMLKREGAEKDYPASMVKAAEELFQSMSKQERETLVRNIIIETQKFVDGFLTGDEEEPLQIFRELLARYKGITTEGLRANYRYFLQAVIPVAEQSDVRMCVHPDDPPYQILGLPRIVTNAQDIDWILNAVDSPSNGLTFCAGSLSAGEQNNIVEMAQRFAPKIHFIHLRSTQRDEQQNFYEANHLEGTVDMYSLVKVLLQEQNRRVQVGRKDVRMPMRPDHGHEMLTDFDKKYNPGYSLIGRMKGLAELSGLMQGVSRSLEEK